MATKLDLAIIKLMAWDIAHVISTYGVCRRIRSGHSPWWPYIDAIDFLESTP